jgi:hypothetical protein
MFITEVIFFLETISQGHRQCSYQKPPENSEPKEEKVLKNPERLP